MDNIHIVQGRPITGHSNVLYIQNGGEINMIRDKMVKVRIYNTKWNKIFHSFSKIQNMNQQDSVQHHQKVLPEY